ncbi:MAG: redoxin domain-containing protein, partial [Bacteroidia bacterium]|nr:redoxin domain-containing protein [Bacteroidia bacterium]
MKTIKNLILLTVVVFMTSAFTTLTDDPGYDIGDIATDFKLKNIDGKMVSLSDYKDANGFIVIFTCNTCPYA